MNEGRNAVSHILGFRWIRSDMSGESRVHHTRRASAAAAYAPAGAASQTVAITDSMAARRQRSSRICGPTLRTPAGYCRDW